MKILLIPCFLLLTSELFSQQKTWETIYSDQSVEFHSMEVTCVDNELATNYTMRLTRIRNKTSEPLTVTWSDAMYSMGSCLNCENTEEYTHTLLLNPGETVTGTCSGGLPYLRVFVKDNAGWIKEVIDQYDVNKVIITPGVKR